jgi:adenylate kinase
MIRIVIASALGAAIATSTVWAQTAPPKIILLVGPPGSGKTTQSEFLAKKYRLPAISMSNLLKKVIASGKKDPVAKALATSIASGDALHDEEAAELVGRSLQRTDLRKGFILDGFPATAGQAKALDRILQDNRLPKAVVVVLDVPDDVIRRRMRARGRVDDKPEIIDRRIREFREQASLLAGWAGQTHIVRVNADAKIGDVSKQIVTGLEDTWAQQSSGIRQ